MLDMDQETVCWLIVKLREFEVEDALPAEPAEDDETLAPDAPVDEEEIVSGYLAQVRADPLYDEVKRIVDDLNEDAQIELVALMWMGRGDYSGPAEWAEAMRDARAQHTDFTADYILGTPLASDYLEEGLNQLGLSCEGTEAWSV